VGFPARSFRNPRFPRTADHRATCGRNAISGSEQPFENGRHVIDGFAGKGQKKKLAKSPTSPWNHFDMAEAEVSSPTFAVRGMREA
jgi:hypothetical protein